MGYVYYIRLQKYLHQKNMRADKKDARYVQFLLKPRISDALVVMPFLEENRDQIKIVKIRNYYEL